MVRYVLQTIITALASTYEINSIRKEFTEDQFTALRNFGRHGHWEKLGPFG